MNSNRFSSNPAEHGSIGGAIIEAIRKALMENNNMLPVRVLNHDRQANRLRVEHLIQRTTVNGQFVDRGIIASVPAHRWGDSKFLISLEIPAGTLGWIKANDRDISLFLRSLDKAPPNDDRVNDFANGIFVPDSMGKATLPTEGLTIQNIDGTVQIHMTEMGVTITAPTITAKAQNFDVMANNTTFESSLFTVNGDVSLNGALTNNGVDVGSGHAHSAGALLDGEGRPVSGTTGAPI